MYVTPLRDAISQGKPILQEGEIRALFSIIDVIYNFHNKFLEKLKHRITNWDDTTLIADLFVDFVRHVIVFLFLFFTLTRKHIVTDGRLENVPTVH